MTVHRHGVESEAPSTMADAFELLLQVSNDGVCLLDATGLCRGVSSAGARVLGYHPRELIGRSFHAVVHASSARGDGCPLCGPAAGEFEGRGFLTRKDGTTFEAACTARRLTGDRTVDGRLVVFTEVDAEDRAHGATRHDTEARLRRTVAELAAEKQRSEAIHVFARQLFVTPLGDLDRTLVDQFCVLTDSRLGLLYKKDEHDAELGLAASHGLFPSGVANRIRPNQGSFGAALSARRPVVEDYSDDPLELAGRSIRHIMYVPLSEGEDDLGVLILARTMARPYLPEEQESVAHLAGLASVALANTRVVGRLERLSQLTRAALDGIVEAIRIVDQDGRELFANASMRFLDQELGLDPGAPFDGPELREIQADPEGRTRMEWELEDRSFERYTAPIHDSLGTFIGRVIVLREVTAERRAERLQADLVSFASHELRTPLTSILGFAKILLEEGDAEPEWSSHVETIRGEAVRLLGMVEDLLDFQLGGAGGFVLSRTRFELADLIGEEVSKAAQLSRIHEVVFDSPHAAPMVEADRNRIAQVLSNLLSNAIKYSPKGGVVRVRARAKKGSVYVSVADSGIGIPEDQSGKIFQKFSRVETEETADIRGIGLGLALCREIVEAHDGSIGFAEAPGGGTVFWFELPIRQ